ncbi:3-oxoacyl-[acyl-carrier-protein] reductase [Halarcobacter ebronensis]|uniref:3-oxoacyl-[acyl-carrier-protein] reductase n=1 Tax=Halarcobacter ebronensis TaxID=1462615 RepID=A0A4Q1ALN1_9BACT|nr:3-oxoacyl-ACP reductase FabG [Halarcobacter ebronensis]QKF80954.1 3-oxoacyl-[acp] reductase [Halarcobacter ebronensis]RXJ68860.1 3-oxoacyl-[acyl-carrier-protein] reductase [Halarcobacter ebronensis]RXK06272.1 3-oxoacyl-[acyl-carrier-protein] reductase [Halarcobacter ebronensis]
MKFSGTNVLVTGASRGIGAEIAKTLGGFGLKVWINYRSGAEAAEAIKEEIESNGGKAAIIKADVTNEDEFNDAIKTIVDADGELSYLVNNAGITRDKLALRMSVEDFTDVINANLTSAFIGCKAALKVMGKKRFGSIVNISSIVGEMGNPGQTNYSASKGGLNAMTKSFAKEAAARNLRYNAVTPGFIQTDMTNELKDEVKAEYEKNIPLSRFGQPKEIAEAVAFLLSDHSSYITGEILKVNGGLYV